MPPFQTDSGNDYTPFGGGAPPSPGTTPVGGVGGGGGLGFGAGGAFGFPGSSTPGGSIMAGVRRRLAARSGQSPYSPQPYAQAQSQSYWGAQPAAAESQGGAQPSAAAAPAGSNPFGLPLSQPAGPQPSISPDYWEQINPTQGGKFSYTDVGRQLLSGFLRGGYLDPRGSQDMISALRARAYGDYGDAQRRAGTTADLYAGDDPSMRAYLQSQAELQGGGDLYRNLTNAQIQSMLSNQDFGRQIVGQGFGANYAPHNQKF